MIRLIVHGAQGRMGRRICALAGSDPRFEVIDGELSEPRDGGSVSDAACDVVIDFSSPAGAECAAKLAVAHGAALLVGTTGLSGQNFRQLEEAAESVPVMIASNTSIGVTVLNKLAVVAAKLLGADFAVEMTESHHIGKRDAPSGTALRLAEVLREQAGREVPRESIRAIREGDIVGEHEIVFRGPAESLRISHSARSRDLFALGALRAAAWLHGRSPGRYGIEETV